MKKIIFPHITTALIYIHFSFKDYDITSLLELANIEENVLQQVMSTDYKLHDYHRLKSLLNELPMKNMPSYQSTQKAAPNSMSIKQVWNVGKATVFYYLSHFP